MFAFIFVCFQNDLFSGFFLFQNSCIKPVAESFCAFFFFFFCSQKSRK